MNINQKMIDITRRKLKYYRELNQVGGCLTPAEFMIAIDVFKLMTVHNLWDILDHVEEDLKKGKGYSFWVYFQPYKDWT